MAIQSFTVTVANPGSGDKFYLDGILQDTVYLAEGLTYRFDQSDSSNTNHPLALSTTSDGTHSGGSEYTTGVSTNGIPGNSGAYTQIIVAASAPTLYYYCSNHSGMGGQANTVLPDTWGLLSYGEGEFSNQDSNSITLSGVSFASDLGTLISGSEQGWGRGEWNQEPWGESYSPTVSISGFSFPASLGTFPYAQSEDGWGRDEWSTGNWGQNTTSVLLDGLSMSMELGPSGWGVNSFSNGEWGGEFTFKPESIIGISGQTMAADVGSLTTAYDMIFGVSGVTMGAGLGTLNINNGADHTQGLASLTTAAAVGSISPADVVGLSGVTFAADVQSLTITSIELVNINGVSFAASVGAITPDAMAIGLSAQTFTAGVGSISPTAMSIGLTGQTFTASLNTVGFGVLAYSDVDITGNTSFSNVDITGNTSYTDVTIAS